MNDEIIAKELSVTIQELGNSSTALSALDAKVDECLYQGQRAVDNIKRNHDHEKMTKQQSGDLSNFNVIFNERYNEFDEKFSAITLKLENFKHNLDKLESQVKSKK